MGLYLTVAVSHDTATDLQPLLLMEKRFINQNHI